jgi:putative transposase
MGITLSIVITAANTHDVKAAIKTLDSIVIKRRPIKKNKKKQQNLCLDRRGYYSAEIQYQVVKRRYIPHIRRRGEKKKKKHGEKKKRRRWVVERTNSWHNRFRKLLTRYEKKSEENYLVLVQLACCIIIYRRILLG